MPGDRPPCYRDSGLGKSRIAEFLRAGDKQVNGTFRLGQIRLIISD